MPTQIDLRSIPNHAKKCSSLITKFRLILVRRVHPRMKSEDSQEAHLVPLGRYSPHEASKLLQRFEQAGIVFRAQPLRAGYGGSNGPTVSMDISVDPSRSAEVDQIHRGLFGDSLPNY